jgi:hypothetical protein
LKKKKKKRKKKYNKQGSEWEAVSWRIASHAIKMKQPVSRWGPSSSTGRVPSIILIRNILIRAYHRYMHVSKSKYIYHRYMHVSKYCVLDR